MISPVGQTQDAPDKHRRHWGKRRATLRFCPTYELETTMVDVIPAAAQAKPAILVFMSAYETAKAGGPHHSFWKEKSKLPNHLIETRV